MKQYIDLCRHILKNGVYKNDRTGTGTISVFGYQMRFDLQKGFPLLTTKKMFWKGIVYELLWFLRGDTNIKYLNDHGVHIWDEWADEDGDLGPIYGKQWRSWDSYSDDSEIVTCIGIDQIEWVVDEIKRNPNSRRLLVNAWNVGDLDKMALPPCHFAFQFYVANGKLSCQLYQRSGDVFLGVPFNITEYALLTHMIAHVTGLEVGEFIHTLGDAHIYLNHLEQVKTQIKRRPKKLPTLKLNPKVRNIAEFTYEDIELIGYNSHPPIKGEVSV